MMLGLASGFGDDAIATQVQSLSFDVPSMSFDSAVSFAPSTQQPQEMMISSKPVWLTGLWWLLSTASAALSGYHGYKRNNSVGWGIAWFALGGIFPVITPTIAFAQGYGKRK